MFIFCQAFGLAVVTQNTKNRKQHSPNLKTQMSLLFFSQFSAKANFLRKKFSKRSFSDSSADRRPLGGGGGSDHGRGGGQRRCIRRGDAVVVEGYGDDDGREEGGG